MLTPSHLQAPLRVFNPRRDAAAAAPAAPAVAAEGQAPFLAEPPPFWKPQTVHEPAAWEVPDAPPLPKEALRAGVLPLPPLPNAGAAAAAQVCCAARVGARRICLSNHNPHLLVLAPPAHRCNLLRKEHQQHRALSAA